jgi:branched-chain amino acid aminotransferase
MPMAKSESIWFNGKFVPWDEANVHVMSHVVHYGSSVFEGMRAYDTPKGPAVWCMMPHVDRLFNSAKIYRVTIPFSRAQVAQGIADTVAKNGHEACYIRPIVFRGCSEIGVDPQGCPVEVVIATLEWGRYLGADAIEKGIDVCVSSWRRAAPDTFPALAKAGGNYISSQLMKMEALLDGYSEAIALDYFGNVSEGSGENVFLVRNGTLLTPPLGSSSLGGITRECVLQIAKDLNIPTKEEVIPREALYLADEVFFTGTAAEVSPIRSVDRMPVGKGERGPITKRLQDEFFGLTSGKIPDRHGWLWPVKK